MVKVHSPSYMLQFCPLQLDHMYLCNSGGNAAQNAAGRISARLGQVVEFGETPHMHLNCFNAS